MADMGFICASLLFRALVIPSCCRRKLDWRAAWLTARFMLSQVNVVKLGYVPCSSLRCRSAVALVCRTQGQRL